ncbi:hypothetical protein SEVIR_1G265450v4 [Setaria viridis]
MKERDNAAAYGGRPARREAATEEEHLSALISAAARGRTAEFSVSFRSRLVHAVGGGGGATRPRVHHVPAPVPISSAGCPENSTIHGAGVRATLTAQRRRTQRCPARPPAAAQC